MANIRLGHAHIDLRCILYSLGIRGDLKDIDGFLAVLLWDEYQRTRDQKVLETLLAYNVQDTINRSNGINFKDKFEYFEIGFKSFGFVIIFLRYCLYKNRIRVPN